MIGDATAAKEYLAEELKGMKPLVVLKRGNDRVFV